MAGIRTPRTSVRSSPRSSTSKSTPSARRASSLRQSTTPTSARSKLSTRTTAKSRLSSSTGRNNANPSGKVKVKAKSKPKAAGRDDHEDGDEEDDEAVQGYHSATGLTETSEEYSSSDDDTSDEFGPASDDAEDEPVEAAEETELSEVDSDFLDEEEVAKPGKGKRKSLGGRANGGSKGGGGGGKKVKVEGFEEEEEEELDIELEEGQEIKGRIYAAPKTGQVLPGRISKNTMNFLANLQIPERNDRDWFKSHEPAFRQAEKEWQMFVGLVQQDLHAADEEVPLLPPKDVIHRIYRDVRFSSDKTPYKRAFSMSTSRGGRKGLWGAYHLAISPNNKSILACGLWQPGKNELATIRHHLLSNSKRFRDEISKPEFVGLFGAPRPHPKGKRQSVFGHEDALKVAPKGVDKGHKDIDLLKLRSIAVVHQFTDEDVLSDDFRAKVGRVVGIMAPFVHMLNDFIALPAGANGDGDANDEHD